MAQIDVKGVTFAVYAVEEMRPFWKTRPLSIGLTFLIGALLLLGLAVMVVGSRFGEWLAGKVHVLLQEPRSGPGMTRIIHIKIMCA